MSNFPTPPALPDSVDVLADRLASRQLDLRMVLALAGERDLNAREQLVIDKLKEERGESLFSDMLYALTHKTFPSRQARTIWGDITHHQNTLADKLGRNPGVMVAAHDYLTNRSGLLKQVSLIEETKLASLAEVAVHDGLTGLIEKRTFSRRLKEELERQHRYGGQLTLVLLDIDHFKKLNDTFGHADGDIVLTQVANIIQEQARTTDVAARYGGEEFAILLIGVGDHAGTIFAERLRQAIELYFADTLYKTTVSVGVANSSEAEDLSPEDFIRRTDEQLYRAKSDGRNCVRVRG